LWGLLKPIDGPVDITILGTGGRKRRRGIRLHRCPSLSRASMTRRHGVPVTTPTRTIADLRRVVPEKEVRRAIRQGAVLGLPLGDDIRLDRTRSDLERDFLQICRRHRLPPPEVNVRIGGYLVDFLWRDRWIAIETDGYRYHRGRQAFRDDRARDFELRARGFEVLRLSEQQVSEEPGRVAEILRQLLASSRHRVGLDGHSQD
jgi:very-short-patch-repair endonuclease